MIATLCRTHLGRVHASGRSLLLAARIQRADRRWLVCFDEDRDQAVWTLDDMLAARMSVADAVKLLSSPALLLASVNEAGEPLDLELRATHVPR